MNTTAEFRSSLKMIEKFKDADWSKDNQTLGDEYDCSREYVRQVRAALGKPKPDFESRGRKQRKSFE